MMALTQNQFWLLVLIASCCLIVFLIAFRRFSIPSFTSLLSGRWLSKNYIWIIMGFGFVLIAAAILLYVHQLPGLIQKNVNALQSAFQDSPEDDEKLRNLAYSFAALAGALTIMATIPFQLIRVWLNERGARTAEQSHITDQINKAVEGLGAEKVVKDEAGERTYPNVEVRVGAIYALERIGQDSARDHVQIMEILTAYIRENSPGRTAEQQSISEKVSNTNSMMGHEAALRDARASARYARLDPAFYDNNVWIWGRKFAVKTDIQATMRVIGRRDAKQNSIERSDRRYGKSGYFLDLIKTNLQGVDLSHLNFNGSFLSDTYLDGANLNFTSLENSDLRWSHLKGANLVSAHLPGANLSEAHIEAADLSYSNLKDSKLHESLVKDSDLAYANLKGADFSQATLRGVVLSHAVFDDKTNLNVNSSTGSALRGNDFSNRQDILTSFFEQAFGDGSVKLPHGLKAGDGVLSHWVAADLDPRDFYQRWRAWQKTIDYSRG